MLSNAQPNLLNSNVSHEMTCIISLCQMIEPFITPSGHSYEKDDIIEWLRNIATDPLTRVATKPADLLPNTSLKLAIADLRGNVAIDSKLEVKEDPFSILQKYSDQLSKDIDVMENNLFSLRKAVKEFQNSSSLQFNHKWPETPRWRCGFLCSLSGRLLVNPVVLANGLSCEEKNVPQGEKYYSNINLKSIINKLPAQFFHPRGRAKLGYKTRKKMEHYNQLKLEISSLQLHVKKLSKQKQSQNRRKNAFFAFLLLGLAVDSINDIMSDESPHSLAQQKYFASISFLATIYSTFLASGRSLAFKLSESFVGINYLSDVCLEEKDYSSCKIFLNRLCEQRAKQEILKALVSLESNMIEEWISELIYSGNLQHIQYLYEINPELLSAYQPAFLQAIQAKQWELVDFFGKNKIIKKNDFPTALLLLKENPGKFLLYLEAILDSGVSLQGLFLSIKLDKYNISIADLFLRGKKYLQDDQVLTSLLQVTPNGKNVETLGALLQAGIPVDGPQNNGIFLQIALGYQKPDKNKPNMHVIWNSNAEMVALILRVGAKQRIAQSIIDCVGKMIHSVFGDEVSRYRNIHDMLLEHLSLHFPQTELSRLFSELKEKLDSENYLGNLISGSHLASRMSEVFAKWYRIGFTSTSYPLKNMHDNSLLERTLKTYLSLYPCSEGSPLEYKEAAGLKSLLMEIALKGNLALVEAQFSKGQIAKMMGELKKPKTQLEHILSRSFDVTLKSKTANKNHETLHLSAYAQFIAKHYDGSLLCHHEGIYSLSDLSILLDDIFFYLRPRVTLDEIDNWLLKKLEWITQSEGYANAKETLNQLINRKLPVLALQDGKTAVRLNKVAHFEYFKTHGLTQCYEYLSSFYATPEAKESAWSPQFKYASEGNKKIPEEEELSRRTTNRENRLS